MDSGGRRVISNVVLEAEDPDTPPNQVYYFLRAEPRFGKLLLKVRVRPTPLHRGPLKPELVDAVKLFRCLQYPVIYIKLSVFFIDFNLDFIHQKQFCGVTSLI